MKYGVQMFPTDYAIPVTELGKACEDLGFESLFFPEHTHIPTSRRTPWPGGAELPKEYSHTLDPFVACGAVAGVTKNLKMGTGICLVMQRDPITLAKEVASVDFLSGGR
ncbi:MAG TPA: LLM class flavin-dependent oxidoreductase, partial [Tepidiformaceae bacterium]|nr:LLM class flavin-dependent oxidoreductase [Tepidiformaceae bacterium]